MPRAVCTFLESFDLDGKTIVPFATSGGSGIGASVATIRSLCPDSTVLDGLLIDGSHAGSSQIRVETWIHSLNLNLSDPEETNPTGGETGNASLPQVRLTLGQPMFLLQGQRSIQRSCPHRVH